MLLLLQLPARLKLNNDFSHHHRHSYHHCHSYHHRHHHHLGIIICYRYGLRQELKLKESTIELSPKEDQEPNQQVAIVVFWTNAEKTEEEKSEKDNLDNLTFLNRTAEKMKNILGRE